MDCQAFLGSLGNETFQTIPYNLNLDSTIPWLSLMEPCNFQGSDWLLNGVARLTW
jgi:hypothetical protein